MTRSEAMAIVIRDDKNTFEICEKVDSMTDFEFWNWFTKFTMKQTEKTDQYTDGPAL